MKNKNLCKISSNSHDTRFKYYILKNLSITALKYSVFVTNFTFNLRSSNINFEARVFPSSFTLFLETI